MAEPRCQSTIGCKPPSGPGYQCELALGHLPKNPHHVAGREWFDETDPWIAPDWLAVPELPGLPTPAGRP